MSFEVQPLIIGTNPSDKFASATLSQNRPPVAFFRALWKSESHHSYVEQETSAVAEAILKRKLNLHFILVKNQKIRNDETQR